jgi:hypothetical protein
MTLRHKFASVAAVAAVAAVPGTAIAAQTTLSGHVTEDGPVYVLHQTNPGGSISYCVDIPFTLTTLSGSNVIVNFASPAIETSSGPALTSAAAETIVTTLQAASTQGGRLVVATVTLGGTQTFCGTPETNVVTGVTVKPTGLPTPAQIRASLAGLKPSGKKATTKAIVRDGGYTDSYTAPGAGKLTIDWYAHVDGRKTLVASRTIRLRAGKTGVKINLTRQGRKLLRLGDAMKINSLATFTPTGGPATSLAKTFTLRR